MLHQIVAFLSSGWKWLENGETAPKGEIEVHHLDHDPTNNEPDNLILLSNQDHKIVSEACSTEYLGKVLHPEPTPLNRRGRPIKNPKNFLANVIVWTMKYSARKFNRFFNVNHLDCLLALSSDIYSNIVSFSFAETKRFLDMIRRMWKRGENIHLIELMRIKLSENKDTQKYDL